MEISKSSLILVTGATGYVASHVIKVLLEQDYKVRSTVRSLANKSKYEFLFNIVPEKKDNLQLVEADLLRPETWGPALEGIEYVLHVASPFPVNNPRNENELIRPAVEGTLNVLNAAVAAGVKKVVLTSSVVSIFYGHEGKVTGPEDWSVEERCDAYSKSKVKAEKAAWDLWRKHEGKFELATVNPGFVLGPIYSSNGGKSEQTIGDMLAGKMPGIPELSFPIVDVRDVAECHLRALTSPISNGKRYICASESLWFKQIASILRREFKKYGYSVPKINLGKFMLRVASVFDKRAKEVISIAGVERVMKNDLSVNELGMQYRKPEVTIVEMGYSLIKAGVVKDRVTPKTKRRNTK